MCKMRKRLVLGPKTKTYQNSLNHVWPIAQSCHFGQVASFTTVELTCTMPLELVSVFKTHSTQPQVLRLCRCKETRVKRALQDEHNMIIYVFDEIWCVPNSRQLPKNALEHQWASFVRNHSFNSKCTHWDWREKNPRYKWGRDLSSSQPGSKPRW